MKKREVLELERGCLFQEQTQIIRNAYRWWNNSTDYELYHVYSDYSCRKYNAFEYCKTLMYQLEGWGLRIIGHNCMTFSVGFEFNHPVTGELCFAYITRDNNRFMKVEA